MVTTPVVLRRGGVADHPWIIALARDCFAGFGEYGEIIARWLEVRAVVSVVAEEAPAAELEPPRRMGFAIVAPHRTFGLRRVRTAELVAIVVVPGGRARGVGRCILERAELLARGWDAGQMRLHTARENVSAQRFFRRAGYEIRHGSPAFYPRGQAAWEMSRRLR